MEVTVSASQRLLIEPVQDPCSQRNPSLLCAIRSDSTTLLPVTGSGTLICGQKLVPVR